MIRLSIRPSSAERWLNCAGYPRIQTIADRLPKEPDAVYAREGTIAHAWIEFYLGGTDGPPKDDNGEVLDLPEDDKKLLGDVADNVLWYAETGGYEIETEKEYAIRFTLPDGTKIEILGHIDVLLYNKDSLVVLDYKHGAGRYVSVVDNPQTLCYLLAAIEGREREGHPRPVNTVMGIIQPRGVGDGWQMINVQAKKLDLFRQEVISAVEAAYQPEPDYVTGPHCWKCPGRRGLCPAILTLAINTIASTPKDWTYDGKEADVESTFNIFFGGVLPWRLLDIADETATFIKELTTYADTYLKAGKTIPGWGLDSVPGRRAWEHPEEVAGALAEILGGTKDQYERKTITPITFTEAERQAKKQGKKIDGLVKKSVIQKRVKMENATPLGFTKVE